MNLNKVLQNIGLAFRAGKVVSGEDQVLKAIRSKEAHLVFLASDAGPSTTKRFTDKTSFYQIKLIHDISSDDLSKAIGKTNRKVLAILNKPFSSLIEDAMNE